MSDSTFGVQLAPTFTDSVKAWWTAVVPLSVGALLTLVVYGAFRYPANELFVDDKIYQSVALDLVGLIIAGTLAVPWYHYALAAADGREIDLAAPFADKKLFAYQAVASFWFWAAVLLGLRYLWGIPSIFAMLLYAFHGYVVADGRSKGGMMALGTSVRLTEGRRVGLFAIAGLLLVFNLFGMIGWGLEDLSAPVRLLLAVVGLTVTSSITLVMGAMLYRVFEKDLKK
jgi:hypothetical protein